jgi:iron complex outermembrane receptor protein
VRRFILLVCGVSGLALGAGPAFAQQGASGAAADGADQPEAIVVTARRRAEDVSKVPISITAFSNATLEKRGVANVADLVKITPGLNISAGAIKSNPFVTIRGQSRGVTGNINPGVIAYMNEVPLSDKGALIPTYDMDNIQVLKGPQGTLFGRNSIGGAVLTYTKAPTDGFGGYVKGDIASFDFKQIEGAINVPVVGDKLVIRLAAQVSSGGGYTKAIGVSPYTVDPVTFVATPGHIVPLKHNYDEYNTGSFRVSVRAEPTDWLKNVTVADYTKIRGANNTLFHSFYPQGFGGNPPALYLLPPATITAVMTNIFGPVTGPLFAANMIAVTQCGTSLTCDYRLAQQAGQASDRVQFTNVDPWDTVAIAKGISNTTTIRLGDKHTLKNIFGYRTFFSFNPVDNEGSAIDVADIKAQISVEQYTDELQLAGSFLNDRLKYTLGGFYYKEQPRGLGGNFGDEFNVFQGLSHAQVTDYITNKSKALYAQFDYSLDGLVNGLSVTAGLRQTWDSVAGCTASATYSPFGQVYYTSRDTNWMSQADCRKGAGLTPADVPGAILVSAQVLPKVEFKKLTYTFGANWQITPDAMVYVTHRRGYRAGSYNTPLFDPYLAASQTFAPETLTDWEVGTKLRWRAGGARGSLEVALFSGKDAGNQFGVNTAGLVGGVCVPQAIGSAGRAADCTTQAAQTAYTPGTPGVLIRHPANTTIGNVGNLTIRGFEIGAMVSPAPWLTIDAGAAYVDYNVDSLTYDPNLLNLLTANNIKPATTIILPQQPKFMANGNATLTYPGKVLGGDLSLNVGIKYSDKFVTGAATVRGYTVADARLELSDVGGTGLDVAVYVKNLTDANYDFGTSGSSPDGIGVDSFIHAPPRTVGVSLRYNFGK